MGKFIVFVIILAGGWYFWPVSDADTAQAVTEAGVTDEGPNFLGTGEGQDATANNPIPDDLQTTYDSLEQRWNSYAEAKGGQAALHDMAPSLAADYSALLRQTYNKPQLKKMQLHIIRERLDPLSKRLFFSSKTYKKDTSGLFTTYTIKKGEYLNEIGRKFGMSYELINILRGKSAQDEIFNQGDELKVLNAKKKGYAVHIDKGDFYMDIFVCDVFIKRYPIGHGAVETETPSGETFIRARVLHPQWTNPKTKEVFNYGEEGHILGPVWLAFDKEIGKSGLGIHGYTGTGKSTGVLASNGCIRMKNEDAIELYNIMVPTSTKGKFITRAPMSVRIVE